MASKRVWKQRIFTPEQWARRMANQRQHRQRPEVRAWLLPYKRAEAERYRAQHRTELRDRARGYRNRKGELLLQRKREHYALGQFTPAEFAHLVDRFEGRCAYCGGPGPLTADHRTPLSRAELQPTNDISNILPACRRCNSSKGGKTESEFREWLGRLLKMPHDRRESAPRN